MHHRHTVDFLPDERRSRKTLWRVILSLEAVSICKPGVT